MVNKSESVLSTKDKKKVSVVSYINIVKIREMKSFCKENDGKWKSILCFNWNCNIYVLVRYFFKKDNRGRKIRFPGMSNSIFSVVTV